MVGVLITLLFAVGAIGVGHFIVGRWTDGLDLAEAVGVHGIVGLGALGLLTLFVGLLPDGLKWGLLVVGAIDLAGYVNVAKAFQAAKFKIAKPDGPRLLFVMAIGVACLFALVGVLAPSDVLDWDTLAYHLAVPKLWLEAGQIQFVPYIHQSNFPFTVESLYIWGLRWGGESGAKAFSLAFLIFGGVSVFGIARSRYEGLAGWWAALTLATVPVVLWESGTGYIDVAHGIYGGLGVVFAARFIADPSSRAPLWLAGMFLGFAAGTKYTGLQTIAAVCFVLFVAFSARRAVTDGFKGALLLGVVAMAVACPWYVRNIVNTGNPVYPFFYEKFGGKNWDQKRADVYRNEQQSFGAGSLQNRHKPAMMGEAVLGLAFQPGRYVNPDQEHGNGTPLGAIGVVVVAAALLWMLSGIAGSFEVSILGVVGLSMLMWFVLSQQSRYVIPLCVPLTVLAGGAIERLKVGKVLLGLAIAQAGYSLYLVYSQRFQTQVQVVMGRYTPDEYQSQTIPFFDASQTINKEVDKGKVALYDEVFGYLLDVPYMWANPPHSTIIPYDSINDGTAYVAAMKHLGFTHVYISISPVVKDRAFVKRWLAAMGLDLVGQRKEDGSVSLSAIEALQVPFSEAERKSMLDDPVFWQDKWMIVLADAVAAKQVQPVQAFKNGILFRIL